MAKQTKTKVQTVVTTRTAVLVALGLLFAGSLAFGLAPRVRKNAREYTEKSRSIPVTYVNGSYPHGSVDTDILRGFGSCENVRSRIISGTKKHLKSMGVMTSLGSRIDIDFPYFDDSKRASLQDYRSAIVYVSSVSREGARSGSLRQRYVGSLDGHYRVSWSWNEAKRRYTTTSTEFIAQPGPQILRSAFICSDAFY